jgi:hypothetical protein
LILLLLLLMPTTAVIEKFERANPPQREKKS